MKLTDELHAALLEWRAAYREMEAAAEERLFDNPRMRRAWARFREDARNLVAQVDAAEAERD